MSISKIVEENSSCTRSDPGTESKVASFRNSEESGRGGSSGSSSSGPTGGGGRVSPSQSPSLNNGSTTPLRPIQEADASNNNTSQFCKSILNSCNCFALCTIVFS